MRTTSVTNSINAFLANPTSANLYSAMLDKTGTAGLVVFSISPTFNTSIDMNAGGAYKYDGLNVIKANTGLRSYFFGTGQSHASVTGADNLGIGPNTMPFVTTGNNNVGIGSFVLSQLTTGAFNMGIGSFVLSGTTTGNANTGVGNSALQANTTGHDNLAFGSFALWQNTTGFDNCAFGSSALVVNSTGQRNTGIGRESLPVLTTGSLNVGIGYKAGLGLTTGSNNTILGANINIGNVSNNIALGDGAGTVRARYNAGWTFSTKINIPAGTVPATAGDAGSAGDVAWDASYIYLAVDVDTWVRAKLESW